MDANKILLLADIVGLLAPTLVMRTMSAHGLQDSVGIHKQDYLVVKTPIVDINEGVTNARSMRILY
jgi:hypothetical protein